MSDGRKRATHRPSVSDEARAAKFPILRGRRAMRVRNRGLSRTDLYHSLLIVPWAGFFALLAAGYALFNAVFALLYRAQDGSIANARPHSFADAFFFSVQTMATIGYGNMLPATLYANVLVTIEVLLGMTGLALATGLIFARFSRPTARVMFSEVAVINRYDGVPTLMFRAANQRRNRILEASVHVMLVRNELTVEGQVMRRFYDLKVARQRNPMFVLTWTVMHPIDDSSPLKNANAATLRAQEAEIVASISGLDESFAQTIYARNSYRPENVRWGSRLADIIGRTPDGQLTVDYEKFHDVEKEEGG
ncbi:MAG: ATP-sensitive inward rectifier potassium channel 10 [Alphaproteobacteria bacterium]|nr:ATP-sensitive inward rectifier potassium channel 10 [Alphaproteobacteria bacterium]